MVIYFQAQVVDGQRKIIRRLEKQNENVCMMWSSTYTVVPNMKKSRCFGLLCTKLCMFSYSSVWSCYYHMLCYNYVIIINVSLWYRTVIKRYENGRMDGFMMTCALFLSCSQEGNDKQFLIAKLQDLWNWLDYFPSQVSVLNTAYIKIITQMALLLSGLSC